MGDFGKLIVTKGLKNLPEVQNITQSGHTGCLVHYQGVSSLKFRTDKQIKSQNPIHERKYQVSTGRIN